MIYAIKMGLLIIFYCFYSSVGDSESLLRAIQQIELILEPTKEDVSVLALAYFKLAKLTETGQVGDGTPAAELYQCAYTSMFHISLQLFV